jgi:type I restriction enzyme, R subunit
VSDTIAVTESVVEEVVLTLFEGLGYAVLHGPVIAPEQPTAERATFGEVILLDRLLAALARINPHVPAEALDEALRKATRTETPGLEENNRRFHELLTESIDVKFRRANTSIAADKVWLIDWSNADDNHWLVVNQFTVSEDRQTRRLHHELLLEVQAVQLEQIALLRCLIRHHGLKTVYFKGLTGKDHANFVEIVGVLGNME